MYKIIIQGYVKTADGFHVFFLNSVVKFEAEK